jgi:hypothetical protein
MKIIVQALIIGILSTQMIICVSGARNLQGALHQPLKASASYSSPLMMSPGHVQLSSSMHSTGDFQDTLPLEKYPDTSPGNSHPIGHHETSPDGTLP